MLYLRGFTRKLVSAVLCIFMDGVIENDWVGDCPPWSLTSRYAIDIHIAKVRIDKIQRVEQRKIRT